MSYSNSSTLEIKHRIVEVKIVCRYSSRKYHTFKNNLHFFLGFLLNLFYLYYKLVLGCVSVFMESDVLPFYFISVNPKIETTPFISHFFSP
jgi:hypothetical protein